MVKLDCDVCSNKIVSTAAPTTSERSYNRLHLRNKGGLVIPSEGVFKVVKAAEHCLHQSTDVQLAFQQINAAHLVFLVKAHVGAEDIFCLGNRMLECQYGIDNHHYCLISLLVSVFHKLRQHHIARLHTQQL
ncbi:hypothetical protein D5F01_LYC22548 [Xyrichtys novacula]|uniref:Uncharacterized protein n=1 Tax=Xyrichtys novacula TaxID=13765 RepID=A0AAV1FGG1_XYRNO|nr:hypothetical protein D5F01_LYC22548 [Xyrichtys novacula]